MSWCIMRHMGLGLGLDELVHYEAHARATRAKPSLPLALLPLALLPRALLPLALLPRALAVPPQAYPWTCS